jgi:predicted amidohydrolase
MNNDLRENNMKIAAYQFAVSGDIHQNYCIIKKAIYEASNQEVSLLAFPECCLTGYPPLSIPNTDSVDFKLVDNLLGELQTISDETEMSLVVGTICREGNSIFNKAVVFRPGMPMASYDKRALWGWDRNNFVKGNNIGVFKINGITVGIRICFEVRFPEYFRELYLENTDLNIILFYDVSDNSNIDRYNLLKAHLQTRAVENVCPILSVNTIAPFQTAPTMFIGKSGQVIAECNRNQENLLVCNFENTELDFGEKGRRTLTCELLGIRIK